MRPLSALIAGDMDSRPVAILRVVVGLNAILCGVETWGHLQGISRPGALRLPFFPQLPGLPSEALPPFMGIWFAAALFLAAGCFTRIAGTLLACQLGYVLLLDEQTYSNHLYLLTLEVMLLVFGNAGARWSVDALIRGRSPCPAWPMHLWKLQISIVYFFAALAKLNPTFFQAKCSPTIGRRRAGSVSWRACELRRYCSPWRGRRWRPSFFWRSPCGCPHFGVWPCWWALACTSA